MIDDLLTVILVLAGCVVVVTGVALLAIPAAVITAGVLLMALGGLVNWNAAS